MYWPEFAHLGGGKNPIVISEVLQTAGDNSDDENPAELLPLGEMGGHGVSVGRTNGFKRSFEEHGYIFGIMSILPRTAYSQQLQRTWSRRTKFDYYWPEFAHLGEQEILNQEVYLPSDGQYGGVTETWGYQQRYAEYKYKQSTVHGDFHDDLDHWHMSRQFDALPPLNKDFVISDPTQRIYALEEGETPDEDRIDKLYVQIYHKISALRPIPYFSIPEL